MVYDGGYDTIDKVYIKFLLARRWARPAGQPAAGRASSLVEGCVCVNYV